ncbi:MAG: DUF2784 family protein [Candidatus Dadabacteria bacterium]|nr:DUF2784 family protein [Candidatus Dadabacteria bacterium]
MPTTQEEASHIVSITLDFIPEEKLTELLIKLDDEVGKKSENNTTKELLSTLRNIVDKPIPRAPMWLWASFYLLVVLHIILVISIFLSFFILPFFSPWYIALPCMTFIWFFSTTQVTCQLTNLENVMRRRLGKKRIGGFVGHYFLKPAKMLWYRNSNKDRRRRQAA